MARAVVGRTGGGEGADALRVGGDCLARGVLAQVTHDVAFLFGTEHEVDVVDGKHLVRLELRVASGDDDEGAGVLAADASDQLAAFFVGQLCDGAGVHQADVGLFAGAHTPDTVRGQFAPDGGRLGEIEFAAERVVGCLLILKICAVDHALCPSFWVGRKSKGLRKLSVGGPAADHVAGERRGVIGLFPLAFDSETSLYDSKSRLCDAKPHFLSRRHFPEAKSPIFSAEGIFRK